MNLTVSELNILIRFVDSERNVMSTDEAKYKRLTDIRFRLVEEAIKVNGGVDE